MNKLIVTEIYQQRCIRFFKQHIALLNPYSDLLILMTIDIHHQSLQSVMQTQGNRCILPLSLAQHYVLEFEWQLNGDIMLLNIGPATVSQC